MTDTLTKAMKILAVAALTGCSQIENLTKSDDPPSCEIQSAECFLEIDFSTDSTTEYCVIQMDKFRTARVSRHELEAAKENPQKACQELDRIAR